jgi:hypothetical protein
MLIAGEHGGTRRAATSATGKKTSSKGQTLTLFLLGSLVGQKGCHLAPPVVTVGA